MGIVELYIIIHYIHKKIKDTRYNRLFMMLLKKNYMYITNSEEQERYIDHMFLHI